MGALGIWCSYYAISVTKTLLYSLQINKNTKTQAQNIFMNKENENEYYKIKPISYCSN